MDRERAETYLRLLAEDELRRAANAPAGRRGWSAIRLELAARALCALGAVGVDVANSVQADFGLAVAERRGLPAPHLIPERDGPAPRPVSHRVVPVGQVISIGDGELLLVAYAQSAAGARFMGTGMPFAPFPATDDRGVRYQVSWMIGPAALEMLLRPDPRQQIRWLDLAPAGQPATRIQLDPQVPVPDVTVTRDTHRPGELMLDAIAARILLTAAPSPEQMAADAELRSFIGAGPGYIVAALDGAALLPPGSPLPGQLAGLCTRIGFDGHGITAPPAGDLPERWSGLLTGRRERAVPPAPAILAATVAELPELDGARITIAGLHRAEGRTIMHLLVSGVRLDHEWIYDRGTRPMLVLWVHDSNGGWHATRPASVTEWGNAIRMCLEIIPPLDIDTAWIEVLVAGRSAQARVTLPLRPGP